MKILFILVFLCAGFWYNEKPYGRWMLIEKTPYSLFHYPEIDLNSNHFYFIRSYGDTVYRGSFIFKENEIALTDEEKKWKIHINSFRNDSLVLCGFPGFNDTLTYIRMK